MSYLATTAVEPLPDFQLLVTYQNGERRIFDMTPFLDKGVFRELRDPSVFNSVRPAFDTVEWSNGADLAPETLYGQSRPAAAFATTGVTP